MPQQLVRCDTGILSRYFGNEATAVSMVDDIGEDAIRINPIIRIEVSNWLSGYQLLTKPKRAAIVRAVKSFPLLHINTAISELAIRLSDAHINSKPGDTLIATTALHHNLPLLTLNRNDFAKLGVVLL